MRTMLLIIFCLILFQDTQGQDVPLDVSHYVDKQIPQLTDLYKHLHRNPEVSMQEERTSALLADKLRKLGFEVTERVGGYGVVAMLRNGTGPQILYRTDMDALPVYEATGLEYASTVEIDYNEGRSGAMHACGHDMHMSTWLGVAQTMAHFRERWSGTLMMIGQPAEELGRGAGMMLEAGLYERYGVPDYGVSFHVNAALPAGQIGIDAGYTMARAESVDIRIFGIGAHGAQPELAVDPIVIASMIVVELQTIVSRNVKPTDAVVITVGAIQGGVKHNIIPDEVLLKLTVRTFGADTREMVHRRIREITRGVALAAGLPEDRIPEIAVLPGTAEPNYNDPGLTGLLRASAERTLGEENVKSVEQQTIAEDFALYGSTKEQVPTVMYWLGTVPEERIRSGDMPGLHTARYYPDPEKSLGTGVLVTTQMLLDLFDK